jgi:hypothetical protein
LAQGLGDGSLGFAAGSAVKAAVRKLRIHPALGCVPLELTHDFQTAAGQLFMAAGHCCDMESCVALFVAIDPLVSEIRTISGLDKDAVYTRHGQRWEALSRRKR